jgi:glycosyltransferase involved in cell wall biosynthesis
VLIKHLKKSKKKISVILPVHNAEKTLGDCLKRIYASDFHNFEVIVVDDKSTDKSVEIAKRFPCKIIKLRKRSGAGIARNVGAKKAKGEILCFIDSDILIKKNTLSLIEDDFDKGNKVVVGIFSKKTRFKNFVSNYKNLFNRFFFLHRKTHSNIFFTGIGAIKKDIFFKLGGFGAYYNESSIEDVEFGFRLRDAGYRIIIDKNIEVEHIKHFSLFDILKRRIITYSFLFPIILRRSHKNEVDEVFSFSIFLPFLILFLLLSGFLLNHFLFFLALALSFLFFYINRDFLSFLRESKGNLFFLKSCAMLFLDMLFIEIGCLIGGLKILKEKI